MVTTVYLIRHSVKFRSDDIGIYNTSDSKQLKTEKNMLTVDGEKRAEILSKEKEFENIDTIYSSNYVRAMQTAKYFLKEKMLLNIDERFNERKYGTLEKGDKNQFFCEQYRNEKLKNIDGESQEEVKKRVTEAFFEVVNNNKGKRIVIVSHGTAISFLLMNWCKLLDIQPNYLRKFEFKGNIIFNKTFNAPEVFKIELDEDNVVINIENIEFEDLPQ